MGDTDHGGGPLADRRWRLIREEARPGPVQMALDEVAAETAAAGGPRTVRVYQWDPSCLSLGYHQDPETVAWSVCKKSGIDVTRRQTGGGGIYHDTYGDISYSIIAPADELPGDLLESYHLLCEPILQAFQQLGFDAEYADEERPALYEPACYLRPLHPAHDILARGGEDDGAWRKVSGNAQYRQRDAVIQHGSIMYAVNAERHLDVFATADVTPAEFRDRVVGIADLVETDRPDAVATIESALADWADAEPGEWTDEEVQEARELAASKYQSEEWVREPRARR